MKSVSLRKVCEWNQSDLKLVGKLIRFKNKVCAKKVCEWSQSESELVGKQ